MEDTSTIAVTQLAAPAERRQSQTLYHHHTIYNSTQFTHLVPLKWNYIALRICTPLFKAVQFDPPRHSSLQTKCTLHPTQPSHQWDHVALPPNASHSPSTLYIDGTSRSINETQTFLHQLPRSLRSASFYPFYFIISQELIIDQTSILSLFEEEEVLYSLWLELV